MRFPTHASLLTIAVSFVVASTASADVPPPNTEPCVGKAVGAACTFESQDGTCQTSTCSRLDYANWDRDASPTPPSEEYECLICDTSGGGGGGGGGGEDDDGGLCAASPSSPSSRGGLAGLGLVAIALGAMILRRRTR